MEPTRRDPAWLLQWAFAAFAALNIGLLLNGSGPAVFRAMGLAGYSAGAVLSLIAALRWHRTGRRLAIGPHLALAPLQSSSASPTRSHAMRHGAYEVLHVVDLAVAIPSMALSIVTGLVVSLGTKWGLVRYRWVLASSPSR